MEITVGNCWLVRGPARAKYHRVAELLRVVSQATAELADEFDRAESAQPKKPARRPRAILGGAIPPETHEARAASWMRHSGPARPEGFTRRFAASARRRSPTVYLR